MIVALREKVLQKIKVIEKMLGVEPTLEEETHSSDYQIIQLS